MELIRTIKVKLNQPKEMFEPTIQAYTKAYNFVCQTGYDSKDFNGVSLHHKTYFTTREYLSSGHLSPVTRTRISVRDISPPTQLLLCYSWMPPLLDKKCPQSF